MELLFILLAVILHLQMRERKPDRELPAIVSKMKSLFRDQKAQTGSTGEDQIEKILLKLPSSNRILRNVYVPTGEGQLTEINLVYITEVGIYVMESKNFKGWIFGNDQNRFWTQTLKGGEKNRFYNPVWQNEGHIKALSRLLKVDPSIFRSYIIFSDRCTIKEMAVSKKQVVVMNRSDLQDAITEDLNHKPRILSKEKIEDYSETLSSLSQVSEEAKERHAESVQRLKNTIMSTRTRKAGKSNKVVLLSKNREEKGKIIHLHAKRQ